MSHKLCSKTTITYYHYLFLILNLRFEKASSAHEAAKEMVTLAEEGFVEKGMQFDAAWQEMLNHATNRVSDQFKEQGILQLLVTSTTTKTLASA